jgi:hypothetical protein
LRGKTSINLHVSLTQSAGIMKQFKKFTSELQILLL